MNSFERRALMQKRRRKRFRNKIIIFSILCMAVVVAIIALAINLMSKPDGNTSDAPPKTESTQSKSLFEHVNSFFQPLDLSLEDYYKEDEPVISSPITLIEDNSHLIDIEAMYSVVIDADNMTVLYNKNGNQLCYPASTTKVLTALTALENCPDDFVIEVGDEIDMIKEGSSIAYLGKGERLTLKMLIDGLLLSSGNDAAYTIAVNVARYINPNPKLTDSLAVEFFCRLMTDKAISLGAIDTNITAPDGYHDENHYTTAYDMGIIALAGINNPIIGQAVSRISTRNVFVTGQDVTWINTNILIQKGSPYYYPYALGIKTGTNDESGNCLLSYAEKNGKRLVTVVMNSTFAGRWDDTIKLFDYFFDSE